MSQSLKGWYCFIECRCLKGYEEVIEAIKNFKSKYTIIGGFEVGEKDQSIESKHFHSFIDCGRNAGLTKLQKKIAGYGDFKIPKYGNTKDMREYCIKLEKDGVRVKEKFGNVQILYESGEFEEKQIGKGTRNDLKKLLDDYNYDINMIKNEEPETYAKYRNGIIDCCTLQNELDEFDTFCNHEKPEVVYHLGESGTGKTYAIQKECRELKNAGVCVWIIQHVNSEFWKIKARSNTNKNPEVIVINEYRDSNMKPEAFLELLEGCGSLTIKGGNINCQGLKKILITSIINPWEIYRGAKGIENIEEEIKRRITKLIYHEKIKDKYITKEIQWREIESFN